MIHPREGVHPSALRSAVNGVPLPPDRKLILRTIRDRGAGNVQFRRGRDPPIGGVLLGRLRGETYAAEVDRGVSAGERFAVLVFPGGVSPPVPDDRLAIREHRHTPQLIRYGSRVAFSERRSGAPATDPPEVVPRRIENGPAPSETAPEPVAADRAATCSMTPTRSSNIS